MAFLGEGKVASTIVSDEVPCYDPKTKELLPSSPGDTAKARSILLAGGWTAGPDGKLQKGGKPLRLDVLCVLVLVFDLRNLRLKACHALQECGR